MGESPFVNTRCDFFSSAVGGPLLQRIVPIASSPTEPLGGVAAAHERLDADEATGLYPYLGYVIEAIGCRVYHAGDTCRYEGLETRLKELAPLDVMFLPINGRDAQRLAGGCIGNMTYQEAVDLAGEVGPRLAVAAHFEMFANNTEDPAKFVEYMNVKFPSVRPLIPEHGRRVLLGKAGEESKQR